MLLIDYASTTQKWMSMWNDLDGEKKTRRIHTHICCWKQTPSYDEPTAFCHKLCGTLSLTPSGKPFAVFSCRSSRVNQNMNIECSKVTYRHTRLARCSHTNICPWKQTPSYDEPTAFCHKLCVWNRVLDVIRDITCSLLMYKQPSESQYEYRM